MGKQKAVVVGLCSHGLAIARSLGRRGIPVLGLESNPNAPGTRSRFVEYRPIDDVNGPSMIDALCATSPSTDDKPILFLTNDNMVRLVAQNHARVAEHYRLNWPDPETVETLLSKDNLERLVRDVGLNYPQSMVFTDARELESRRDELRAFEFPVALKPAAPLSPFKAARVVSIDELFERVRRFEDRIDRFLIQEWIEGTDRDIYFACFYFDRDTNPLVAFSGRKVRSFPRGTGGACSAEPATRTDILDEAMKLFKKHRVAGPASLEFKADPRGRLYVIEPTIGRFDFWVKCCIANGVDLPLVSYSYRVEGKTRHPRRPGAHRIWVDFEHDFPRFIESLTISDERPDALRFLLRRKSYAVWAWNDMRPSLHQWPRGFRRNLRKLLRRAGLRPTAG